MVERGAKNRIATLGKACLSGTIGIGNATGRIDDQHAFAQVIEKGGQFLSAGLFPANQLLKDCRNSDKPAISLIGNQLHALSSRVSMLCPLARRITIPQSVGN
jgi:hypothetical protein